MNSKEKTKQHFNQTASNYNSSDDGKFVQGMYDVLVDEILKSQLGKILDVGCGNGNLFTFLPDGRYELFGVDFSENMIIEAKNNCKAKASFNVADAERLPFSDDTFDIVVCNASFHHYIHPNTVLEEMHRVLRDGGKVLIGDPYIPTGIRGLMNVVLRFSDSGDYHIYGLREMENLFAKNGFNPVSSIRTGKRTAFYIAEK
ncbi:class I SAM-dependent methyltransferase [Methanobrevibacter sp.]|uniref:class I SAM-dependent methyltransferase n=1 Tax=Methanobrevibacter sp. TaxID=66852 RepID=UPI00388D233F